MASFLSSIFKIWNAFIDSAVTILTTSPKSAAGGQLYSTASSLYNTLLAVTVPLATVFFIIAIYKDVVGSPPEQQPRRFFQDTLKYIIILYISSQLWTILGYFVDFADGITAAITVSANSTHLEYAGSSLETVVNNLNASAQYKTIGEAWDGVDIIGGEGFGPFFDYLTYLFKCLGLCLAGAVDGFIFAASGISILNCAFQRIIKPLIVMPFSTIVLGIGSCTGEGSRMMWHFGKSFLGLLLSGALMLIGIKLGVTLATTAISFSSVSDGSDIANVIVTIVQTPVTALVVAGICKSVDQIMGKIFG